MNRNIRVLILLVLLIIIPFLIYAFLQLNSLREDEQMADEIYEKQMDAILFSLNQYADDMMGQWIRQLDDEEANVYENARELLLGNESIQILVLRKMADKSDSLIVNEYIDRESLDIRPVEQWYADHDSLMRQLSNYLDAGFQKIQAAEGWQPLVGLRPSQAAASIMLYDRDSVLFNGLIVLEANFWAGQILGSRMVELARDNFNLAIVESNDQQDEPVVLFSTNEDSELDNTFQRPLWILPNTYLVISPRGETYSDLIRKRNRTNITFLLFSLFIVLLAGFLIIRNIRNMIRIAQLKSDFVANVSHEIRTPISLIQMYAETLLLGRVREEKKEHYYNVIHHESGRLTYLVNNILDFSRIEANRKTYNKEPVDLNTLVERVFSNYNYTFKEKNVKASFTPCEGEILVEVDPSAFDEALSNLIDNAIKYSEGEIEVTISTGIEKGFGFCSVRDSGRGITRDEQERIFDKFYRVEGALTQKTRGTGLGLSLVKHIVDAHDGKVEVKSAQGEGSVFILMFPLIDK